MDEMKTFLDCSLLQRRLLIGKSIRAAKRMLESQGRSACGLNYCKLCHQYQPTGVPSFLKCARCRTRHIVPRHENLCEAPPKFEIRQNKYWPILVCDY